MEERIGETGGEGILYLVWFLIKNNNNKYILLNIIIYIF